MIVRLNKFIASAGLCSRREADKFILEGRVRVNGKIVQELGVKIDADKDKVVVDEKPIFKKSEKFLYILMNKPKNVVVSVKDQFGRKTVMDIVAGIGARVFPVGRLDADSQGVLLLTNDGELAFRLTHPSFGVKKVYEVRVKGMMQNEDVEKLRQGVFLEGKRRVPVGVQLITRGGGNSTVMVYMHEGIKREVRKLMEAVGYPVRKLVRVEFAGLKLKGLKPGQWRLLGAKEVATLNKMVGL